jgi:hypothetical protein
MYYHCIVFFDVRNLVLCLTRELIKFIDYKIILKLQNHRKLHTFSLLLVKISSKSRIDFGIIFWKIVVLYEICSKKLQWPKTFCTSVHPANMPFWVVSGFHVSASCIYFCEYLEKNIICNVYRPSTIRLADT